MGKIFPKDLMAQFGLCNFFNILTIFEKERFFNGHPLCIFYKSLKISAVANSTLFNKKFKNIFAIRLLNWGIYIHSMLTFFHQLPPTSTVMHSVAHMNISMCALNLFLAPTLMEGKKNCPSLVNESKLMQRKTIKLEYKFFM